MSTRLFGTAAAFSLGCLGCGRATAGSTPVASTTPLPWAPPLVAAVIPSSTAFFGTVVRLASRTTDAVTISPLTTVVRLDSMIASDSTVDINAGDSVTVVVLNATGLDVGTTYGFLAYGLVLDSSAVLQETWRADASTSARRTAFLDEYRSARTIAEDQVTFDHLPEVDLVIAGVVTSVDTTALPDSIARKNRFETAPAWRRAALRVRRILRGDSALTAGTVPLLFPGGTHIIYSLVPRPQTGDSGVYLVHGTGRFAGMSFAGLDTAGTFVLFHSVDVRPLGDTARVIRLLHAVRPTRAPAPD